MYAYIVECKDKAGNVTCYVGRTTNLRRRITEHITGRGAKYLRGRTILRVVYSEDYTEHETKKLDHVTRALRVQHAFLDDYSDDDDGDMEYASEAPDRFRHWQIPRWRPAWTRCSFCEGKFPVWNIETGAREECAECNGTGGEWLLEEKRA